jgi:hypothetical protein
LQDNPKPLRQKESSFSQQPIQQGDSKAVEINKQKQTAM